MSFLTDHQYREIVKLAPLIAIDLLIRDSDGKLLLGRRINEPAKGYWFVPGGRIRKGETVDEALRRISRSEIGVELTSNNTRIKAICDHMYGDELNTHYVVLAHSFCYDIKISREAMLAQHDDIRWASKKEIMSDPTIHQYVQKY